MWYFFVLILIVHKMVYSIDVFLDLALYLRYAITIFTLETGAKQGLLLSRLVGAIRKLARGWLAGGDTPYSRMAFQISSPASCTFGMETCDCAFGLARRPFTCTGAELTYRT